jgi:hypothetical protein
LQALGGMAQAFADNVPILVMLGGVTLNQARPFAMHNSHFSGNVTNSNCKAVGSYGTHLCSDLQIGVSPNFTAVEKYRGFAKQIEAVPDSAQMTRVPPCNRSIGKAHLDATLISFN